MMHGYLALDEYGNLLTPFRTWRNTHAEKAADELTELFRFNMPMRWSVSQYYQAILDGEEHVKNVKFLTTLAGYIHYKLTGRKVLGVGDASGMFPINGKDFDRDMLDKFNTLLAELGINTPLEEILPTVLVAADDAGTLSAEGALLLDPTGKLKAGVPMCPPEGDAGTGMVATNCIAPRTANVSAGTSAFLMAVLERNLNGYYKEIDVVTTPHAAPVAMVHVNNFASEITAWTNLFSEVLALAGAEVERGRLFDLLYASSLDADDDCGGLVGYNFLSGEPIVDVADGSPLFARAKDGRLSLSNFMKMHIYSALASLSIGREMLEKENVKLDSVYGHGGFFKSPTVGQSAMSAALGAPVTVLKNAGEGGAWGIAVLALFAITKKPCLDEFLAQIFKDAEKSQLTASEEEVRSFTTFMERYKSALPVERLAGKTL
jgi:sugar (pentulose or hexulose) kinase